MEHVSPLAGVPTAAGLRSRADRWLAPLAGLCAAGPVMASTLRALHHGWLPAGDQAIIATRAYDVLTSRTPLVGQHSDAGALTHHALYSLGPMLYWLLALPARLASPGTLTLTVGMLNTAAILGIVVLARRHGGRVLMFATALAVAIMSRSLATEVLHDVWNPAVGLFPFTLLVFLCWSLACGEYRLLPLTVLVASFVIQCQLAFLAPSLGALAIGMAGLVVSLRSPGAGLDGRVSGEPGSVRRWVLAALLIAVVCWTPPAIDQIEGNPGNLTAVVRAARANKTTLGAGVGWHAVALTVGIPPWWLTDPASPWQRKNEVRQAPSTLTTVSALLALLALTGVAAFGLLRRRVKLWAGALIALVLCLGVAAVAAATPTSPLLSATLGYTMWLGSPVGMFVWVILAWAPLTILELRRPRSLSPVLVSAAGVGAVALAALAVAAAQRPDEHLHEYRPLGAMSAALERGVPGGRTVLLLGSLGNSTFRFKMAARFALARRGIRPLSPGTDTRLGSWYQLDHHRYDCTVYVEDGGAMPDARAAMIAGVSDAGHPVSVWVSPAGCPKGGAAAGSRPVAASPPTASAQVLGTLTLTSAQATPTIWVSYPVLLAQVRSGPLIRAIINAWRRDVEIKFRNLNEWHAVYPAGAQPELQRLLRARHIRLLFVPRPRAKAPRRATVHHHLRYIAAGAIAVLAALALLMVLYTRRRRR